MTESASSVSKGLLQSELGGSWQRQTNAKITTTSLTHSNLLLRYGISINTELRLGIAHKQRSFALDGENSAVLNADQTGFVPLMAGLKTVIIKETPVIPQLAVLSHLYLNRVASRHFRGSGIHPELMLAADKALSDKLSLGVNIGGVWDNPNPQISGFFSSVLGVDLNPKTGMFLEYYQSFHKDYESEPAIASGITWLARPNLQLDASGSYLLYGEKGYSLSIGISYRAPK
jgi:hypothetical protein